MLSVSLASYDQTCHFLLPSLLVWLCDHVNVRLFAAITDDDKLISY